MGQHPVISNNVPESDDCSKSTRITIQTIDAKKPFSDVDDFEYMATEFDSGAEDQDLKGSDPHHADLSDASRAPNLPGHDFSFAITPPNLTDSTVAASADTHPAHKPPTHRGLHFSFCEE